jgi:hypothetical protein
VIVVKDSFGFAGFSENGSGGKSSEKARVTEEHKGRGLGEVGSKDDKEIKRTMNA